MHESVLFICERQRVVCMKRSDLRVIDEGINTKNTHTQGDMHKLPDDIPAGTQVGGEGTFGMY